MSKTMDVSTKKKDAGLHNSLVYVVQHWQLYVFFLLPALALTIIFRYIPMGGILIAFEKYNPIKGITEANGYTSSISSVSCPRLIS